MPSPRPARWVSSVLYAAVLFAGGYASLTGLGDTRPVPFFGGLFALVLLDVAEHRRYPAHTPRGPAALLLVARFGLFLLVVTADGAGLSRVLFLLLPFAVYFTFGRRAALAVGLGCVGLVVASLQATVPGWYRTVEPVSDVLMFTVGLVLTVAMASVAVGEQRARARLEEYAARVAELSATAERNRLARDIHDSLGHHLTAITILLEKATTFRGHDADAADLALVQAQDAARRALDDVRRSVRTLRAETTPFRLASALDDLVRAADDGRLAITLQCTGDERRYDSAALTALYRAAQEALTNARRHAGANRVAVTVQCDQSRAQLVVTDDGRGFFPERHGFGLLGMRERVELAGGSVDIRSEPGAGTQLTVTIPPRATA